jgi:ribosomal-protein-alanine N-acetyltransferase
MTIAASPYSIRPMTAVDLPQVAEVEAESFTSVWPSSAYKRELQANNLARYVVAVQPAAPPAQPKPALERVVSGLRGVFRSDTPSPADYVVGFIGVWLMVDEAHIVTVAVRESERRKGIGELLLLAAFDLAWEKDVHVLTLECRVSNTGAQALYEKYGFERAGIRKRYYSDNNEDALIMTTPSTVDSAYRARIEALRQQHQQRWGRT